MQESNLPIKNPSSYKPICLHFWCKGSDTTNWEAVTSTENIGREAFEKQS